MLVAPVISLPDTPPIPYYLTHLRGRVRAGVRLAERCWFQVGGEAEWLFVPEDTDDLAAFLRQAPRDMPITVIGVGSNLLVRDGGIEGVVIRLGRGFAATSIMGDLLSMTGHRIRAGAAALDVNVALFAREEGLEGLEFLSGIPGTIGGALAMNAGAYGREIKDVLIEAEALDRTGTLHRIPMEEMRFSYRHCGVPEGWIFVSALFRAAPGDKTAIAARMNSIENERQLSQPVKSRTGGSTFKNPPGAKAWELIDASGCRGLRLGGAQVSEKHCNFLINTGGATAADLEALGEEVRRRVKEHFGVELKWEIKRMGNMAEGLPSAGERA